MMSDIKRKMTTTTTTAQQEVAAEAADSDAQNGSTSGPIKEPPKFTPHPDITRILGNIYISGFRPISDHVPLRAQYKITHIVSTLKFDTIPEYLIKKGYTLKVIPVDDSEEEDIFQYLNETNGFIDRCLFPNALEYDPAKANFKGVPQQGAILVHCQAGMSRSVAFVMAYLMYRYRLSLSQALYAVQRRRPGAQPNENFMRQLEMFESLGAPQKIEYSNCKPYKAWKLELLSKLGDHTIGDELYANGFNSQPSASTRNDSDEKPVSIVRCKKCRHQLAASTSFIEHEPPSKASSESHFIRRASKNSRRIVNIQDSQSTCSHYFVEPLLWMKPELDKQELEGKFFCPGCGMKVGAYNWKGSRCSCGKWVVPAIHLLVNKVDCFPVVKTDLPNLVNFST